MGHLEELKKRFLLNFGLFWVCSNNSNSPARDGDHGCIEEINNDFNSHNSSSGSDIEMENGHSQNGRYKNGDSNNDVLNDPIDCDEDMGKLCVSIVSWSTHF